MKRRTYLTTIAFIITMSLICNTTLLGQNKSKESADAGSSNKGNDAREAKEAREAEGSRARTNSEGKEASRPSGNSTVSVASGTFRYATSSRILQEMRQDSANVNNATSPTGASMQANRLEAFVNSLPYSDNMRRLQNEMAALTIELNQTDSAAQERQMLTSVADKSMQIQSDPAYIQNVRMLAYDLFPEQTSLSRLYRSAILDSAGISTTSNAGASTSIVTAPPARNIDYSQLQPGDIMLIRHPHALLIKTVIYALYYTHAGNYLGNQRILESNEDGVRIKPLRDWQIKGACVALGRNNKKTAADVKSALEWAEGHYGSDGRTPYNYNYFDKQTDRKLYCSQLTWKIHQRLGIDLDSNDYHYLAFIGLKFGAVVALAARSAIAPDEIRYSSEVEFYSEGCN
ncbi:MAG TPA: YiiX/YebB-like N1pC/P60 family cysteine hydrolase [Pyrinomonadaceae bacterium]|jgi:hypothetical protein